MERKFCWVAFQFLKDEKCQKICDAMDQRTSGWDALPFGVTKTAWTQQRCRKCKYHKFAKK